MDDLLAGTLFSFIYGVSMPGNCPALLHLLLLACGKHSAPSRTPFRQTSKTVRLPTGTVFAFRPECCSESHRNGVRLHNGIAFAFDRIPQTRGDAEQSSALAFGTDEG
jgi:hypothetical protein